jgi:hypothetical protein
MTLSVEQIKALANPYAELGDSDSLIEHREQLNSLSEQEQRDIAIKIISHCPNTNLNELGYVIRALKPHGNTEETFADVISRVFDLRKRIMGLTDDRNSNPHKLLLAPEFESDLFAEFNKFSLQLLNSNEATIAKNLVLSTPEKKRFELVFNVRNAFPGSLLVTKLGEAFTLRREIEHHLLSEKPYNFFTSLEFNPQSYLELGELLLKLIKGKEDLILSNLETTPEGRRSTVLANMESIFSNNTLFSALLEKTKELFKTPTKTTAPTTSIFLNSMQTQTTSTNIKDEAGTGKSLSH